MISSVIFNIRDESPRRVVANLLNWGIIIIEFELQSGYYVQVRINTHEKVLNHLSSCYGLYSTSVIFYNDGFDIKLLFKTKKLKPNNPPEALR